MNKELDNAFVDVRAGFRLLFEYQTRVQQIVNYIREHTPYPSMWGNRLFCNTIHTTRKSDDNDYANLAIHHDMWGWDFLYNYLFEYFFGTKTIGGQKVDMSVIQVSDDGYFKSPAPRPSRTKVETFLPAADSDSWLILQAGSNAWMTDDEIKDDYGRFLKKFLASDADTSVYKNDDGHWFVAKKYPMQCFASQAETDRVMADFGRIVAVTGGVELFKV